MQSSQVVKALLNRGSAWTRIQRFVVADLVYEVEYEFVGDALPALYCVRDPQSGHQYNFSADNENQHYEVLLAALDHMEELGELPMRVAVFDPERIVSV